MAQLTVSDMVGFVAGACTTLSFLPQVVKAWRTRSTRDISLGMYLLLLCGITLWLVHGFQIGSLPVMAANAVTLVLVVAMVYMKLRYK
jgi:MtN3 and saliva related transmembrane protein